ncbi:MAG: ribosomal RNA small subunit methyltransferase A [Phycisphaerae bacterium]|nr:ribosomal RNA small subunit methyltransferase A [Gemmatimonadaceae bacterium]
MSNSSLPRAKKSLGQHFLHDEGTLDAIVEALGPIAERTVLEIGPGRGVLTDRLASRAGKLVAVELDKFLAGHLTQRYAESPHVNIVQADVLQVSLAELAGDNFVLVGNVPYYITTPILFHALERPRPTVAVYLVQREVAERMAAPPGSKTYGALSVNVQSVAHVELVRHVPPEAFHPAPAVDSAVVRVVPRSDPAIGAEQETEFRHFVQSAFSFRRKQLGRVLRNVLRVSAEQSVAIVEQSGLTPDLRPEVLSAEDFARLLGTVRRLKG